MASVSETGHAKNVANLEDLISFCTGYGASYNPSKASISLAALTTKRNEAVSALAAINTALPPWKTAVNARQLVFEPINKLVTRVVNAVAASDVPAPFVKDVKSMAKKIQGVRAGDKKTVVADNPESPKEESSKTISTSQLGFNSRIENMDKLIQLLSAQPAYKPNEADLKVAALSALLANMKTTNTAAINAYTPLSNARIKRNKVLYDETTGVIKVAGEVKAYVKSVFGATSPQYKQFSKLKFTTPKV